MTKQNDELTIRRILVALDASHHSLAALDAAAELAASLEAEVQGLFVEDVNLLRAARSPAAREVQYPIATTARLDRARMERALRAQATQARRALAACCERRQVKYSFRVVRGKVAPEVLAAAMEADLLSLGKASLPLGGRVWRVRLGSTARAAAAQAPRSVLLIQRGVGLSPPVMVVYDGSSIAQRALTMAARLAQKTGEYLAVLMIASASDDLPGLKSEAADLLRGRRLVVHYRTLANADAATIAQQLPTEGKGVLVLSIPLVQPDALDALLDQVECPVLLIRGQTSSL